MYRVFVLAVVLTVVSADSEDVEKKCRRLLHPGTMRCCKNELIIPKVDVDQFKECMDLPHKPPSCELEICVAKKRGYGLDDGTIDKAAFEKMFSEDFESSPTLVKAVKDNCLTGDLDSFSLPDACELVKMKNCVHVQAINDCKEWDDNGPCAGVKDLVKECAKFVS